MDDITPLSTIINYYDMKMITLNTMNPDNEQVNNFKKQYDDK